MVLSVNRITNKEFKKYDVIDDALISTKDFVRNFGEKEDFIEAHLYDENGNLIFSDYDVKSFSVPGGKGPNDNALTDTIEFDPGKYIEGLGFTVGTFDIEYNILRKKLSGLIDNVFFIKEISADRTEIRLSSNIISNIDIETGTLNFIYEIQSSPYFKDFLLNFGENRIVNGVNIILDKNTNPYSVLVKLYKPLPEEFDLKFSCNIVEELSESFIYKVEIFPEIPDTKPSFLRPANFDIDVENESVPFSDYISINTLLSNNSLPAYRKLLNRLKEPSVSINVDYSYFSNFVHFSSAKYRVNIFKNKLSLLEGYNADIDSIQTISNYSSSLSVSSSVITLQNKISEVIEGFDGYEKYLYYTSASAAWPKSGSGFPYLLYNVTSSEAVAWMGSDDYSSVNYGGALSTASLYDQENQDNLVYSVPEYITIDDRNESYITFLAMIGHHFDNIWLYIKSITDLYKTQNNLSAGISKDMVFHMLRSMGVKLYNSKSNENIFDYFLGVDSTGNIYPVTSSYETLITSSGDIISGEDQYKEKLKRIYHNLSYINKSKGTGRGIKSLISSFGIPSTVMDVIQFGGSDKSSESVEYSYDRFTYALQNSGSSYIKLHWGPLTQKVIKNQYLNLTADSVEFRFKPSKLTTNYSSSLLTVVNSGSASPVFGINLNYSPVNDLPYGNLVFMLSGSQGYVSCSVSLPFYFTGSTNDTEWWNALLRRNSYSTQSYYDLYVKNEIGGRIGHQSSASIYLGSGSSSYDYSWKNYGNTSSFVYLYLGGSDLELVPPFISGSNFEGQLQEFRLWSAPLSESAFNKHVLNPESIQGNYSSSAYDDLAARFPLGNNLLTYNHYLTTSVDSVHPRHSLSIYSGSFGGYGYGYAVYGTDVYGGTGSSAYFLNINTASFYNFPNEINYDSFTEEYFTNTPNAVYANPINKKVRIVNNSITGSVLSPFLKLEESPEIELSKDIHLVDASFSPQNEINKDIISHFGNTINVDDLIGDPSHDFIDQYPDLITLNADYFKKYSNSFNYRDFIRIVNFFDNSLFKMIKDYTPARSNLQTGLTIKSPILERPRIKKTLVSVTGDNYSGSVEQISDIQFESIYSSSYGDGSDFYTGELSGSLIDVNDDFEIKNTNPYKIFSATQNNDTFSHTDFNVTMNNVSASRKSVLFKKVNNNNPNILEEAEIQDSYYSIQRHVRPRYDGSKSTSQLYNVYTEGDTSYGKNAAIDINTLRFAWINEVNERNFNFVDKSNVNIKYLVDSSSSLTELTRNNDNIFEVQNLFKSGKTTVVSLLDQMNPTNQADLAGTKNIWQGGFSYSPIIYREINETLYFNFLEPVSSTSSSLGIKAVATSSLQWQTIGNADTNFFDTPSGNTIFKINGVSQAGAFSFTNQPSSAWPYTQIPLNTYGPYKKYNGTYFDDNDPDVEGVSNYYTFDWFLPFNTSSGDGGYVTSDFIGSMEIDNSGMQYVKFTAPRQSTYTVNLNAPIKLTVGSNPDAGWSTFKIIGVIEKKVGSNWVYQAKTTMQAKNIPQGTAKGVGVDETYSAIFIDDNIIGSNPYIEVNCILNNFSITLNQGDQLRLVFYLAEMRTFFWRSHDIDFQVEAGNASEGYWEIYDSITTITTQIQTGSIESMPVLFTLDTDYKTLVFNNSASVYYSASRFLEPSAASSDNINFYYSPIVHSFLFNIGDIIRFTSYFTTNADYYNIAAVFAPVISYTSGVPVVDTPLKVILDRQISSGSINTQHFAFLRREADETNVMLNYNKREGKTSSGLLIPYNLQPDIKNNTADIIGPLKDKILSKVLIIN